MTVPRVLIACIGNIFLGDDGFGVEVARRLAVRVLPVGTVLKDFGIRGIDLTYALLEPWDLVILVDACQRGGGPGSLYLIEPDAAEIKSSLKGHVALEAHTMHPMNVLHAVCELGGAIGHVRILGCEPAELGGDDGKLGLSEPVTAAIGEAIGMIEALAASARADIPGKQVMQVS